MLFRRIIILSIVSIIFFTKANSLLCQRDYEIDRSAFYQYGSQFSNFVTLEPAKSTDSVNVNIFYRIMYSRLTFVKNPNSLFKNLISAYSLEITFNDSEGIVRRRTSKADTIYVSDYEKTKSKVDFIYSHIKLTLPINQFRCNFELFDINNQVVQKGKIELPSTLDYYAKPKIFYPIIAEESNKDLIMNCVDKKAPFTSNKFSLLAPIFLKNSNDKYYFRISKNEKLNKDENLSPVAEVAGTADFYNGDISDINLVNKGLSIKFSNIETVKNSLYFGYLKISSGQNNFTPGNYTLTIFSKSNNDTSKFDFEVNWENMPLSLQNPEYALSSMYYILNDDEFDKLENSKRTKLFKNIYDYWAPKDPTPATPYNEAMAEFFKRADYAYFNFKTIAEKNGIKTDKGMIYILYGKPDEIKSDLKKDKSSEIWYYKKLKKTFTFELVSEGIYKINNVKE